MRLQLFVILLLAISSRTAKLPQPSNSESYDPDAEAELDPEDEDDEGDYWEKSPQGKLASIDWQEHWSDLNQHKENLSRVYLDEHLSVEFDTDISESVTWPFALLSSSWQYVKEAFGPFGPDPHLYVVLHASKYDGCLVSTFWMTHYEFRNVIDCGTLEAGGWTHNSTSLVETLLAAVAHVIRNGAKGVDNIADDFYCATGMVKVLVYDLYVHLKSSSDKDVMSWKQRQINDTGCFVNWALPIYKTYGGVSVINNFYNYTFMYWPQAKEGGYVDYMNLGEWIHFWSGAADADLFSEFGNKTMLWESWVEAEVIQARKDYPHFNYSIKGAATEEETGGLLKYVIIAILVFIFVAVFLGGGILAIHRKMN